MTRISNLLIATSLVAVVCSCNNAPEDNIDSQVDALYGKMSQEERIAQLHGIYMTDFFDENGNLDTALCAKELPNGVGHISQFALNGHKGPDEMRDMVLKMQNWLVNNTPNGIPALFHEEVLSGVDGQGATVYPQQIGLACSFNPQLAEQKTFQTATALRSIGGVLALSPMVDVVRNPSFNRLEESYGEDSYLSASMGVAFVKGLQHGDLRKGAVACTKHFLGYGGGGDSDKKELMEEILLPHEAIIRLADSKVVMTGYHAIDGVKCVANREIQQGILRDYLHFDGLMVSDYSSISQIDDNMSDLERTASAINAGNDVDFPKGDNYRLLQQAIDSGLVSQSTFEASVKRVLRLKAQVGLLDENPVFCASGHVEFDTPEERQTAYQLATQSVVLLKNNGILPLKDKKNIALTGPNANSMWAMLGDYTYHAMRFFWKSAIEDDMHPRIVNLKDGLENRLPEGIKLNYSRGCDWTEVVETVVDKSGDPRVAYLVKIQNRMIDSGEDANMDEALKMAGKSDVVIVAVGENAILCGENRDRTHLRLPGRQEEFVEKLIATGKPVVMVIFGGRAQVISGLAEKCDAVIQAWYPGEEGGNALADIIYGNVNPSGKLSVSYPAEEIHEPVCYNYGLEGDARIAYPFGYGLSYTTYEYSNMKIDSVASTNGGRFNVSVDVKNAGSVDGEEIVQLYVSPKDGDAKLKPIQLQGFKRVALSAGETKTVTFAESPQQLGYYDNGQWSVDAGRYIIKIGASSADIRQQKDVTLVGDKFTMALRDCYFAE